MSVLQWLITNIRNRRSKPEVREAFNNRAYSNLHINSLSRKYETANKAGCSSGKISAIASKSYETSDKNAELSIRNEELLMEYR